MTTLTMASPLRSIVNSDHYRTWWNNRDTEHEEPSEIAVIVSDDDWKTKYLKSEVRFAMLHGDHHLSNEEQRKLRIQLVLMKASMLEERENMIRQIEEKTKIKSSLMMKEIEFISSTSEQISQELHIEASNGDVIEGKDELQKDPEKAFQTLMLEESPKNEGPVDSNEPGNQDSQHESSHVRLLEPKDSIIESSVSILETRITRSRNRKEKGQPLLQEERIVEPTQRSDGQKSRRMKCAEEEVTYDDKENKKSDIDFMNKAAKVKTRHCQSKEMELLPNPIVDKNHSIEEYLDFLNESTKDISPIEKIESYGHYVTDITESNLKLDDLLEKVPTKKKRKQNLLLSFKAPVLKKKIRERN